MRQRTPFRLASLRDAVVESPSEEGPPPSRRPKMRRGKAGILAIAIVGIPFAIGIARLTAYSGRVYLSSDLALIDLHVRDALNFHQLLGPYDRYGWNHPGPVYFYLLSVVARVIGSGARADFVGTALINGLSGICVVWIVRRRAGPWAALFTATCLAFVIFVVSTPAEAAGRVVIPWNPYVVTLPLVLFCTLVAAGATGSWPSFVGAALVASFLVQTDIATGPFVVVLLLSAFVFCAVKERQTRTFSGSTSQNGRSKWLVRVGGVLLALIWVPTLVEQIEDSPGNIALIWRFFSSSHTQPALGTALRALLAACSVVMGRVVPQTANPLATNLEVWLMLPAIILVATASIVLGVKQRVHLATALGSASLVGLAMSFYSNTRIVGPILGYLVLWEVAVPILALVGIGVALLGPWREPRSGANPDAAQ